MALVKHKEISFNTIYNTISLICELYLVTVISVISVTSVSVMFCNCRSIVEYEDFVMNIVDSYHINMR